MNRLAMRPIMVPLRCNSVLYSLAESLSAPATSDILTDAFLFSMFVEGCAVLNENNTSELIADIFSDLFSGLVAVFIAVCIFTFILGWF